MAAQKLDRLWDGWMKTLSGSYVKTVRLVEAGKESEASSEFQRKFLPAIREVYSEAACSAPKRFAESKDWSSWLRRVYAVSIKTDKSLRRAAGSFDTPEAKAEADKTAVADLRSLRKCFHVLHTNTKTLRANDYLYGFYEQVMNEAPAPSELKKLQEAMDKAELSTRAKTDAKAFRKAKAEWVAKADSVLADGAIQPSELESLRTATEAFYRAYGEPFE